MSEPQETSVAPHPPMSARVRAAQSYWDATAATYQEEYGDDLSREPAAAWGLWRVPEAQLNVLDDVRQTEVLDLGCGGGHWCVALAGMGASPVGLDVSRRQLEYAHRTMTRAGRAFSLVQGDAESLPFPDRTFGVVLSDHGAVADTDPALSVPEIARVLHVGGTFVMTLASPFLATCVNATTGRVGELLYRSYWNDRAKGENDEECVLTYSAWFALFRKHGLVVERLEHLAPRRDDVVTGDMFVPLHWARRWPSEDIWKVRRV